MITVRLCKISEGVSPFWSRRCHNEENQCLYHECMWWKTLPWNHLTFLRYKLLSLSKSPVQNGRCWWFIFLINLLVIFLSFFLFYSVLQGTRDIIHNAQFLMQISHHVILFFSFFFFQLNCFSKNYSVIHINFTGLFLQRRIWTTSVEIASLLQKTLLIPLYSPTWLYFSIQEQVSIIIQV